MNADTSKIVQNIHQNMFFMFTFYESAVIISLGGEDNEQTVF